VGWGGVWGSSLSVGEGGGQGESKPDQLARVHRGSHGVRGKRKMNVQKRTSTERNTDKKEEIQNAGWSLQRFEEGENSEQEGTVPKALTFAICAQQTKRRPAPCPGKRKAPIAIKPPAMGGLGWASAWERQIIFVKRQTQKAKHVKFQIGREEVGPDRLVPSSRCRRSPRLPHGNLSKLQSRSSALPDRL